jgi:hypothetical protein
MLRNFCIARSDPYIQKILILSFRFLGSKNHMNKLNRDVIQNNFVADI